MTTTPDKLAELEAVNIILSTIGERRISTLSGQQVGDVAEAQATLTEISRAVQGQGWHFNREKDVPFARDVNNEILIPTNVARFDVETGSKDIINRGGKAYNKTDRTFTFTDTLKATVVYYLPFNELPDSARYYITIRAARTFANRHITSTEIEKFSARDEYHARADFLDENEENADQTLFDNWTGIGRALDRPSRRT